MSKKSTVNIFSFKKLNLMRFSCGFEIEPINNRRFLRLLTSIASVQHDNLLAHCQQESILNRENVSPIISK